MYRKYICINDNMKTIATSYNKVAHDYVKQHGYGEHLALPSLISFIKKLKPQATVLDVGCGGGQDSKFFVEHGFKVLGIDVSKEMIKLARQFAPQGEFKVIDFIKMPSTPKYDAIWCCRVFHHVSIKEQKKFLSKLRTLTKPGGYLYLTSVVSETKNDYEAYDSGSDKLLKKRLQAKTFKKIIGASGFEIKKFKYWVGKKGMEIVARKIC